MNKINLTIEKNNSELQGYAIQLKFNLAEDETRVGKVPYYRYCFLTTPLYYYDSNFYYYDTWNQGAWISLNPDQNEIIDDKAVVNIVLPSNESDLAVQVLVEAQDDNDESKWSTASNTDVFAAFYNTTPKVDAVSARWESDSSFSLTGKIVNHGIFKCANYAELSDIQLENYYSSCHNLFNVKLTDSGWIISAGKKSEVIKVTNSDTATEITDANKDFTINWATGKTISLMKEFNTESSNWYSISDTPYKIKFTFNLNGIEYFSNNTIQMAPFVPPCQILKGAIKAQLKKNDPRYTGGAMLNHGVYTEANGDSVALYDTAIPEGQDRPRNNPSIGFYDNDHKLLARIKYENGTLKTEDAEGKASELVIKWIDLD
jgi:hypothetical protein